MSNVVPSDYGQEQVINQAVAATPPTPPMVGPTGQPMPFADQIPPQDIVNDPTRNPDEPVTAGLTGGPGIGPAGIQSIIPPELQDDSSYLMDYLQAMEHVIHGSTSGSSAALRIQARLIRARLPPEKFLGAP